KYMTVPDWVWNVWDNAIHYREPTLDPGPDKRLPCGTPPPPYLPATFLLHVNQHLPHEFNQQICAMFLGEGRNEVAALTSGAWDIVTVMLLYLVCYGASTMTMMLK
ncbi:hypothetical protein GY45DRAFT_1235165, partial [Cubamyces sp. BRFM 1775]